MDSPSAPRTRSMSAHRVFHAATRCGALRPGAAADATTSLIIDLNLL